MGRHRRSDAGRAATGRAATEVTQHDGRYHGSPDPLSAHAADAPTMGIAPYLNPEAYAETSARSEAYLFATEDGPGDGHAVGDLTQDGFAQDGFAYGDHSGTAFQGNRGNVHPGAFPAGPDRSAAAAETAVFASDGLPPRDVPRGGFPDDGFTPGDGDRHSGGSGGRRRKKKAATPVRTGLLGVSAAVALGTVAVATGAVPGLENYKLGGDSSPGETVEAAGTPTNTPGEQGGTSGSLESPGREAGTPASRDSERSTSPKPSPSAPSAEQSKTPEAKAPEKVPEQRKPAVTPSEKLETTPPRKAAPKPEKQAPSSPVTVSEEAAAGAQVLQLVNQERAKVGCSPVAANSALTGLAAAFSQDMAERGFFDHTDPDGDTPWDRAKAAGIADLGGENIARGQATAAAVMEAWMDSPGHKANILNCDFKTLGVGVHFGPGGPWWTQNFGY
ncbi:CAP domain-containing protein [Streptomyces sp. M2CJ-2]|uniref:CAP domain-containing protein n=1 Tax=Streptomyces sp. M2CJ-2 TaxID=2803948 RepID=UPI001921EA7A|nr:CAP domain-containing protein [Streptomyces sp. M2CJ-2]MBL3665601.1 CAP domain-containing protein [Streptomyces sp. M2CJ-2]